MSDANGTGKIIELERQLHATQLLLITAAKLLKVNGERFDNQYGHGGAWVFPLDGRIRRALDDLALDFFTAPELGADTAQDVVYQLRAKAIWHEMQRGQYGTREPKEAEG